MLQTDPPTLATENGTAAVPPTCMPSRGASDLSGSFAVRTSTGGALECMLFQPSHKESRIFVTW